MLVGTSGSGKTTLCRYLLENQHPFAAVFIFTGTYAAQEYVKFPRSRCYPGFQPKLIADIVDAQEKKPAENRKPILIVLDDLMGEINSTSHNADFFNRFSTIIRKDNISLLILQQTVSMVSKASRLQASSVMMTTIGTEDSRAFCAMCPGLTPTRLREIKQEGRKGVVFLFDSSNAYDCRVWKIEFPKMVLYSRAASSLTSN